MANYIGKISALVTASTADLERKLNGGVASVRQFGRSISSQITSASTSAERSLNSIFTPLQRIQRALDIGSRSRLQLIDDRQLRQTQQAVSIAEQINRPLASAARGFQQLSAEVGGAFLPALIRAQDAAERATAELATTGGLTRSSFEVATRAVDETTAALNRLNQARQIIDSAPRGRELQFTSPQVFAALQESAEARRGAGAPGVAGRVGADLGRAVEELVRFDSLIQQTEAEIASIRLIPRVDNRELEAAQGRLQEFLAQQRLAREEVQRLSAPAATDPGRGFRLVDSPSGRQNLGLFGTQTGTEAERAVQRARELDAEFKKLPATAQAGIGSLAGIADRLASEVAATGSGAENLNSVLAVLAQRIAAAAAEADEFSKISAAADAAAKRITSLAQATETALGGARPTIDSLEQEFRRLLATISRTGGSQAGAFEPLTREILELFAAAIDGSDNLDQLSQKIQQLRNQSAGGRLTILEDFDQDAESAKQALDKVAQSRNAIADRLLSAGGGQGEAGLSLGIDERGLRSAGNEIEFLQDRLSNLTADVRGPSVAALQRYRQVVSDTFRRGAQNTEEGRKAIAAARAEVVRLAAEVLNVKPARLGQQLKRVGDVGRAGFGNISLGIQQAAFAVDDFFSVTGGLEQRIRAAGNNISQLGFVLGSTEGLIAGIAFSIGAQLVAALIKWNNAGTESRDRTEALNQALARQKSLVEDLAKAFDSLGDRLLRGVFSPAAEEAREVARQIEEIQKKQRELRDAAVVDLDPEVNRQRAIRGARERQLENEEDVGRRTALQQQIAEARRAEQAAAQAAINRPAPTPREIQEVLLAAAGGNTQGGLVAALRFGEVNRRRALTREQVAGAGGDQRQLLELLRTRRQELLPTSLQSDLTSNEAAPARFAVRQLTGLIERLERELAVGINNAGNELLQSIEEPAKRLRAAQDTLREAVEAGVPGAASLLNSIDQVGAGLDGAVQTIVKRFEEGLPLDQATVDAATRQRDAALRNAEAALRSVAATDSARISAERFAETLDRVAGQLLETVLSDTRGAADQARREANRVQGLAEAGFAQPRDAAFAGRQRDRRNQIAADAAAQADRIERDRRQLQNQFQDAAAAGNLGAGLRDAIRRRDAAQAVLDNRRNATPAQVRDAEDAIATANRQLGQAFEAFPAAQRLAALVDAFDAAAQGALGFADAVEQGRNLVLTDAQRVADDFIGQVQKINAALEAGEIDRDQRRGAIDRLRQDGLRQLAPTIFGLADQVANAVLQGPSRAALQATDVSTVEGARELNRLLRGDDAARDQPLVELQREANRIAERIARGVENNEAQVAQ